ncbi:MAG: carboxypeptidase M32 [Pirellulales bacterium]
MRHDQTERAYEQLVLHARETALLASIEGLLGWDERTMLPTQGGPYRAEQMSFLAGEIHRRQTDPRVGEWLAELDGSNLIANPHSDAGATVRGIRRRHERQAKLPQSLVEELARTAVLGQQTWTVAREANDFARLAPLLEKTFRLKREQAEAIGYEECRYDALLDDFEPYGRTSQIVPLLAGLRNALVPLIDQIRGAPRRPRSNVLTGNFPEEIQRCFSHSIAQKIGFDFRRGRLDTTHHPFCGGAGPHDVRITTRYDPQHVTSALFGTLHEAGHGIYEQGLPNDAYGLPLGEAVSLGIHESQSRLWENQIGRGRPFWDCFYTQTQQTFAPQLNDVTLDDFYFAINEVRPSLIRVEADEATYNLHVLIRFELERALLDDQLQVADLPAAWNEAYRAALGIEPETDRDGLMQDIHWSAGLIGYFPTYALGNLYAAQFFEKAEEDIDGLATQVRQGAFHPLAHWLQSNIHTHGQRFTAAELVNRVTGRPLAHQALIEHLTQKLGSLYGI